MENRLKSIEATIGKRSVHLTKRSNIDNSHFHSFEFVYFAYTYQRITTTYEWMAVPARHRWLHHYKDVYLAPHSATAVAAAAAAARFHYNENGIVRNLSAISATQMHLLVVFLSATMCATDLVWCSKILARAIQIHIGALASQMHLSGLSELLKVRKGVKMIKARYACVCVCVWAAR